VGACTGLAAGATACNATRTRGIAMSALSVYQLTRVLWQNERNLCPHFSDKKNGALKFWAKLTPLEQKR